MHKISLAVKPFSLVEFWNLKLHNVQGKILIHSANPKSRTVVIIVFTHVVRLFVRTSVRISVLTFQIYQNKTTEHNGRYWRDCGSGRVDHWWHLSCWSTMPTTVPAGSDHYFHTDCPSVHPSQNFKIKRQSVPVGTVGWPSGSLMTPVLFWLFSSLLQSFASDKNIFKLRKCNAEKIYEAWN